jgi:hypothetical protein
MTAAHTNGFNVNRCYFMRSCLSLVLLLRDNNMSSEGNIDIYPLYFVAYPRFN